MTKKEIQFRDPVVERVVDKFVSRSDVGFAKYGVTLEDDKSNIFQWVNHLQEELMDAANYIEKIRAVLIEEDKKISKYPESSWTSDTTDKNWDITY